MATITQYALGFLLVAHGYVHFWYVVLSRGWVDAEDAWGWNGRSWLLSAALDERTILDATSPLFLVVALGFAAGALGFVLGVAWWRPLLVGSALLSTVLYLVLWDGGWSQLPSKGGLGVLVNLAVLAWVVLLS